MRIYFEANETNRLETKEIKESYMWAYIVVGALALCLMGYML